jgi:hypothetical protein
VHDGCEGEDRGEDNVGREGGAVAVGCSLDGSELWIDLSVLLGKGSGLGESEPRACNLRVGRN